MTKRKINGSTFDNSLKRPRPARRLLVGELILKSAERGLSWGESETRGTMVSEDDD